MVCDTTSRVQVTAPLTHLCGPERIPGTGVVLRGPAYHWDPNSVSAETAELAEAPGQAWEFILLNPFIASMAAQYMSARYHHQDGDTD